LANIEGSFWRRHRWLAWTGGGFLVVLLVLAAIAAVALHRAEPFVRARIVDELQNRFHARVELDSFHMSLLDGLQAEGKGLRIWPPNQVQGIAGPGEPGTGDPMISLADFRFRAPLRYQQGQPFHISIVQLKGLDVRLPPKSHFENSPQDAPGKGSQDDIHPGSLHFALDKVVCEDARLLMETSKPGKLPLEFQIAHLNLTGIGAQGQMHFEAELTNPRPVGTIHTHGEFGPWEVSDPGQSPVEGDYEFDHADLSGFKGIAGILNSTGHYKGTLRDIVVDGETNTPDFELTHFGNKLPLHTHFHARVDGTNGDTWLEPVDATLGHSHFTAQGQVVRVMMSSPGVPPHSGGHDIALNVNVDHSHMEDFLNLASRSPTPLLTGALTLKALLHIPPGSAPVHQRMMLNGKFALDHAQFTSDKIQGKIESLSERGLGRPKDVKTTDPDSVQSAMQGDFKMAAGVITLPNLQYTVPGAEIDLAGTYGVDGGTLNFAGNAKLQATVSQMVGGWKGMLLKSVDHYFKKDGAGTEVPIHVEGTRDDPKFGVDLGPIKVTAPARSGEK